MRHAGNYGHELSVDRFRYTAPVGSFPANAYGIHDMSGNVWEWCADGFGDSLNLRVVRGGSWRMDRPDDIALATEIGNVSNLRLPGYGFRCVLQMPGGSLANVEATVMMH